MVVIALLLVIHAGVSALHCAYWRRRRHAHCRPSGPPPPSLSPQPNSAHRHADEGLVVSRYGDVGTTRLPVDVYMELAAALVLAVAGAVFGSAPLKDLRSSAAVENGFHALFGRRLDFSPIAAR